MFREPKLTIETNSKVLRKDSDCAVKTNKANSPIVETFAAIVKGTELNSVDKKYGVGKADASVELIKKLGNNAFNGDFNAKSELNTIQKFILEPKLKEMIQLFNFMGTFKDIDYSVQPVAKTYKHESIKSQFQAGGGDVPFGVTTWNEEPVKTQTISSGYAVDYREVASGNLDKVSEGMEQTKIDMINKSMGYVVYNLYAGVKNATGIKYFAEAAGIAKSAVDDTVKKVRRFGRPALVGDFSVVSQLNGFSGFTTATNVVQFSEEVMKSIMETGLLSFYNGSPVIELPNKYDLTTKNTAGNNFKLYLPEGLLFALPQATVAPLQIFRRGGVTSMTAQDIYTASEVTRFDMEIGSFFDGARAFEVGLISDTNFEQPSL